MHSKCCQDGLAHVDVNVIHAAASEPSTSGLMPNLASMAQRCCHDAANCTLLLVWTSHAGELAAAAAAFGCLQVLIIAGHAGSISAMAGHTALLRPLADADLRLAYRQYSLKDSW